MGFTGVVSNPACWSYLTPFIWPRNGIRGQLQGGPLPFLSGVGTHINIMNDRKLNGLPGFFTLLIGINPLITASGPSF